MLKKLATIIPRSFWLLYNNKQVKKITAYGAILKYSEATTRGVLLKKVFLVISQNSQENTCVRVSFLIKLQAAPATFLWILRNFKNTVFYRTPLVAASDKCLEEFDLTFTFSKIVLLKETIKLLQHMQLISLENKSLNFNHDIFPRFIYLFLFWHIYRPFSWPEANFEVIL